MSLYTTKESITAALQLFNQRAYNAALEFKVDSFTKDYIYILASFDFAYYVNVEIECREILYTNIQPDERWPDAWNTDQIFLLSDEELEYIIDFKEIEINTKKPYFGIVFNITGKENYFINGTVICTSLEIIWRSPVYED